MITLGPLRETNLTRYYQHRNMPYLRQYFRQIGPLSEQDHRAWWDSLKGDTSRRLFEVLENDCYVGVGGLCSIDYVNRRAELSLYTIKPEQYEPGLFKILDFAFMELGLNRVWAEVFQTNRPTLEIMDKYFEYEGSRHEHYYRNGRFISAELYSISNITYRSLKKE